MNGQTFAIDTRRRTGTSTATLPDAALLPIANNVKDEICSRITEKDENYFIIPALQNLVVSDIDAREYALPDDVLNNLVSVELAFDGTKSPLVYVHARRIAFSQAMKISGGLTEANIIATWDNSQPYYYIQRRSLWILSGSISAVTNGLKIRYRAYPTDLANFNGTTGLEIDPTTTSFGIPRQFHKLWAMKTSIDWKQGRPKPIPLSEDEKGWEKEMEMRLTEIKKNDLKEELTSLFPNTTREGNNGSEL